MEKLKNKRYLIAIFLMTVTLIVTAATYVDTVMSDKRIETALKEYGTQIGAQITTFEEITETGTYYSYPYNRHDTLESMKNDIDTLRTKEENIHIHIYPVDSVLVELTSIIIYTLIMTLCALKMVHTGLSCLTSITSVNNKSNIVKHGERIYDTYMNNRYSINIPCTMMKKYKRDKIKYMISLFFVWTFFIFGAAILLLSYIREDSTERYVHMMMNNIGFISIVTALFIVKNNISNNIYRSRKILYSKIPNVDLRCMYCYLNEKYINMNCDTALMSIIKIGATLLVLSIIMPFSTSLIVQLMFLALLIHDNRKQEILLFQTRIKKYSNTVSFAKINKKYKIIKIK